jgi:hypothetical protein
MGTLSSCFTSSMLTDCFLLFFFFEFGLEHPFDLFTISFTPVFLTGSEIVFNFRDTFLKFVNFLFLDIKQLLKMTVRFQDFSSLTLGLECGDSHTLVFVNHFGQFICQF